MTIAEIRALDPGRRDTAVASGKATGRFSWRERIYDCDKFICARAIQLDGKVWLRCIEATGKKIPRLPLMDGMVSVSL